MRNLKRVLSLALACVMVIGMMVMTTGAADFTDADEITYTEAVEVMSALEVLGGYNGIFDPNGTLTRDQGAAIIARMLIGAEKAGKLVGTGMFKDTTGWSAGVVEYCANLGILGGYNGEFFPGADLTPVQFGKMLLCALGYDADVEGYNGDNWAFNIAADMIEVGLDIKGLDLDAATLTREQAAQMALTTLSKAMVAYETKGTKITVNGMEIVTGASAAKPVTSDTEGTYNSLIDEAAPETQQFAEKYFKDLSLNTGAFDGMGRPANEWAYNLETIGTYARAASYTTVAKAKANGSQPSAADVVDTISKNLNDVSATVVGATNSGALEIGSDVEIYLDNTGAVSRIVVIEYDVATVLGAVATKTDKGTDYISIPGVTPGYVKAENVKGETDLAKFDVVLYYVDGNGVYTIEKAASVTGIVTGIHSDKGLEIGGAYYNDSTIAGVSSRGGWANDYINTYEFFLDHADRIVKAVMVTEQVSDNYLVVKEAAWVTTSGVDGDAYLEARIVNLDGTTEVVKIASVDDIVPVDADTTTITVADGTKYDADAEIGDAASDLASTGDGGDEAVVAGQYFFVANEDNDEIAKMYYGANASNVALVAGNTFYSYEVDDDGYYYLYSSATAPDSFTYLDDTSINDTTDDADIGAPANDSTVFIYAVTTNGKTKYTVYTGLANAPKTTGITNNGSSYDSIVVGRDGFAKWVFVATTSVASVFDADLVYVVDNASLAKKVGNSTVYVYDGLLINGVEGSMTLTNSSLTEGTMYVVSGTNAATGAKTLNTTITGVVPNDVETGISANGGNTIVIGSNTYTYTDETVVYYIDEDGNSTQIDADAIALDATDSVYVVVDQVVATKANVIYVVDQTHAPSALTVTVANGGSCTVNSNNNDLAAGRVGVTGATLGTTTIDVSATPLTNVTVDSYNIKGNGTNAVAVDDGAYTTVATDSVITVTVTVTDDITELQYVYTYTLTIAGA